MKKIAVIDLMFNWPPDGGARTDLKEIIQRLNQDYEVALFVPQLRLRGKNAERIGVSTVKIPVSPLTFNKFTFPKMLRREVDKFKPDLIFFADGFYMKPEMIRLFRDYKYILRLYAYEGLCLIQNGTLFRDGVICPWHYHCGGFSAWFRCTLCSLKWLYNTKNLFFLHEYILTFAFRYGHKLTAERSFSEAAAVIGYNNIVKERIGHLNANINVVTGGIDLNNYEYLDKNIEGLNNKETINLLMVGRVSDPSKGFKVLLEAFGIVRKKYSNIQLHVTRNIKEEVFQEGVIAHDWLPQEKLPELYKMADICIVPSAWPEPFGIVALEAMACGVPLIVSKVGGLGSIVENGVDGLTFDPGNHEMLAKCILSLIDSSEKYCSVKEKAREKVQRYSWDSVYEKQNNIIKQILK